MPDADSHDIPIEVSPPGPAAGATRSTVPAGRGRLALAAVVVAAIVAVIVVWWAGWLDDGHGDDAPPGEVPAALVDREWVMAERFDAEPSARPALLSTSADGDLVRWVGANGCVATDMSTAVTRNGDVVVVDTVDVRPATPVTDAIDTGTFACDQANVDPFVWEPGDTIDVTEDRLVVRRADAPLARFSPVDRLPAATEDDLVGVWLLEDLTTIGFRREPFGEDVQRDLDPGPWCDGRPRTWSLDDGVLTIDGPIDTELCSLGTTPENAAVFDALRREVRLVLAEPSRVRVAGDSLVVIGDGAALTLQPVPAGAASEAPIDVSRGTAFGVAPGLGVSVDDVLAAVEPALGPPTYDSGWTDVVSSPMLPCSETNDEYRELAWGDLWFAFWQRGARTALWYWTLGPEPDALLFERSRPDVDRPTDVTPSGLTTESGLGIGNPADDLVGPNVRRVELGPDEPGGPIEELVVVRTSDGGANFLVADERITGISVVADRC